MNNFPPIVFAIFIIIFYLSIISNIDGRKQGVGNFLQGGGTGDYIVWVGEMGSFGINGKDGRGDTHRVPAIDQG